MRLVSSGDRLDKTINNTAAEAFAGFGCAGKYIPGFAGCFAA
jgi:hypothetical protein